MDERNDEQREQQTEPLPPWAQPEVTSAMPLPSEPEVTSATPLLAEPPNALFDSGVVQAPRAGAPSRRLIPPGHLATMRPRAACPATTSPRALRPPVTTPTGARRLATRSTPTHPAPTHPVAILRPAT